MKLYITFWHIGCLPFIYGFVSLLTLTSLELPTESIVFTTSLFIQASNQKFSVELLNYMILLQKLYCVVLKCVVQTVGLKNTYI